MNREELIGELAGSGLDQVSAVRAAFLLRASAAGWTDARIARQLGITRMRVAQRKASLRRIDAPLVRSAVAEMDARGASTRPNDHVLAFDASAWKDIEFGMGMIETVGS